MSSPTHSDSPPLDESMAIPPDDCDDVSTNASGDAEISEPASSSSSSEDPAIKRPPCRVAARYLVRCPECRVTMQIGHFRYRHVCKRSADPRARAAEMQERAKKRFRARTADAQ